jgi:hypothetical protein
MRSQAAPGVSACLYYIRYYTGSAPHKDTVSPTNRATGHPAGSSSRKMSHVQARPAVWFSQNPERWRSRRWPSPRVTGHLGHSHVSSPPIADSVRLTDVLFASAGSPRSSRSGCLALPVVVSGFAGGSADLAGRCLACARWTAGWLALGNGLACQLAFGAPVPGLGCHARGGRAGTWVRPQLAGMG